MCLYGEEELKSKRLEKRRETPPSFFSREKSCQLHPKATIEREEEEKKNRRRSETVSGKTFATAIEITPREKRARTKPNRSNSRSAFHFFSRGGGRETQKFAADERRITFTHFWLRKREREREKKKTTKFARTFCRRSRSWWVRSRRGHFYISRADISADKSCSR